MLSREEIEDALIDNVEGRMLTIELTDGMKLGGQVLSYHMIHSTDPDVDDDSFEFLPNNEDAPISFPVSRVASVEVHP